MEQTIEDIINEWFELTVIRNKDLTLQYKIHNSYLEVQCKKLYQKYGNNQSYNSFVANYIYHVFEALLKVEDFSDLDRVSKQVYSRVKFSLMDEKTRGNIRRIRVDGDRRATLAFHTVSLDSFLPDEGDNQTSLVSLLTSEDNIFYQPANQIYFNRHFKDWLDEHREEILTDSQIEFLKQLNSLPADASPQEVEQVTHTSPKNINNKVNRIADRIIKAYQAQKKNPVSQYQKDLTHFVNTLFRARNIANRKEDLETLNQDLFQYLTDNFIQLQPHLDLTVEEHQAMNRKIYSSQLLYKVSHQIDSLYHKYNQRLTQLFNTTHTINTNNRPSLRKFKHNLPPNTTYAFITNKDGYIAPQKEENLEK